MKDSFRYQGEHEAAQAEVAIAEYVGSKYCVAFNSCTSAIYVSLLCAGVKPGDKVLIPAFTFTAVPSAVINAGAIPILVETNKDLTVDMESFTRAVWERPKCILLSYIRGHIPNLDEIRGLANKYCVTLIEDAAHALGADYDREKVGTIGSIGCFSTQSFKILSSGEGGFLVTDIEELAARAIFYSGSYEDNWKHHISRPNDISMLYWKNKIPCLGLRMTNAQGREVVNQLPALNKKIGDLNVIYAQLEVALEDADIYIPKVADNVEPVLDTLQFTLNNPSRKSHVKRSTGLPCFGDKDNARAYWNWEYLPSESFVHLEETRKILENTFDIKLREDMTDQEIEELATSITLGANG